jgi:colanic acid/amylovoran biosynthesis glycosyltransferase
MNTVVSQALACGLAVFTTRHSGLPEQVIDGVDGFLVDEGDWQALAERIVYLARHPELLPAMSEAGRAHVARHYDASALIDRQLAVYESLARAGRSEGARSG